MDGILTHRQVTELLDPAIVEAIKISAPCVDDQPHEWEKDQQIVRADYILDAVVYLNVWVCWSCGIETGLNPARAD